MTPTTSPEMPPTSLDLFVTNLCASTTLKNTFIVKEANEEKLIQKSDLTCDLDLIWINSIIQSVPLLVTKIFPYKSCKYSATCF